MIMPVTVTAAAGPAAPEPESDLTVDMFDFGFGVSDPIEAGVQTFKLTNSGPQDHEMAVVQMAPGATPEEVLASFEPGFEGPPMGIPNGGLQALKVGGEAFVDLNFTSGSSYLLVCFIPDQETGAPHFTLGMLEVVTIP